MVTDISCLVAGMLLHRCPLSSGAVRFVKAAGGSRVLVRPLYVAAPDKSRPNLSQLARAGGALRE
jgi:hypothetical protein